MHRLRRENIATANGYGGLGARFCTKWFTPIIIFNPPNRKAGVLLSLLSDIELGNQVGGPRKSRNQTSLSLQSRLQTTVLLWCATLREHLKGIYISSAHHHHLCTFENKKEKYPCFL